MTLGNWNGPCRLWAVFGQVVIMVMMMLMRALMMLRQMVVCWWCRYVTGMKIFLWEFQPHPSCCSKIKNTFKSAGECCWTQSIWPPVSNSSEWSSLLCTPQPQLVLIPASSPAPAAQGWYKKSATKAQLITIFFSSIQPENDPLEKCEEKIKKPKARQ